MAPPASRSAGQAWRASRNGLVSSRARSWSQRSSGNSAPGVAAVSARDLRRVYGEGPTAVHALRGVDLDVDAGRLTAVMGPSGSGKSTLMHLLAGLDHPDGGTVTIGDVEVIGLDDAG